MHIHACMCVCEGVGGGVGEREGSMSNLVIYVHLSMFR